MAEERRPVVAFRKIILEKDIEGDTASKRDSAHDQRRIDAVPDGKAKGLNITLRWAAHRSAQGYTAPGNTRGNSNADEYRVIVDYPFSVF